MEGLSVDGPRGGSSPWHMIEEPSIGNVNEVSTVELSILDEDAVEEANDDDDDTVYGDADEGKGGDKENRASVTIDINDLDPNWVTSIRERHPIEPRRLKASSIRISCSIHRVPHCLRRHEENVYMPHIVSIGPFHYDRREDQLQLMEEHKWRYLHDILLDRRHPLESHLIAIKKLERTIRSCYSEEVELNSNSFVEMMVLDGWFIIELCRRAYEEDYFGDPIFKLGWLKSTIEMDLLMLENQIPFIVLLHLCKVMGINRSSLVKWTCSFFGLPLIEHTAQIQHLLHLVHYSHLPFSGNEKPTIGQVEMIPNASKLQEAGIKFKKGAGSGFLDIKFQKGDIKIPPLKVKDTTHPLFLNLVAFEQCYRHCNSYFAGYTHFMDCLIDNAKDVQILCDNGIIDRWLSSDKDVAALFNKMGREVIVYDHDFYLHNVCKEINRYSGTARHAWRASLMRNYFSNPWAIISVVAAVLFLFFSFTQTFFNAFPKFAFGS